MTNNEKKSKRLLLLSQEELNELGTTMQLKDKSLEKEFWKNAYEKRGIIYVHHNDLVNEFDELISNGKLHLTLIEGKTILDLSDNDKITLMKSIKEIEIKEDN